MLDEVLEFRRLFVTTKPKKVNRHRGRRSYACCDLDEQIKTFSHFPDPAAKYELGIGAQSELVANSTSRGGLVIKTEFVLEQPLRNHIAVTKLRINLHRCPLHGMGWKDHPVGIMAEDVSGLDGIAAQPLVYQSNYMRHVLLAKLAEDTPGFRAIANSELRRRTGDLIEQLSLQQPEDPAISVDQHMRDPPVGFEQRSIAFQHEKQLGAGISLNCLHEGE